MTRRKRIGLRYRLLFSNNVSDVKKSPVYPSEDLPRIGENVNPTPVHGLETGYLTTVFTTFGESTDQDF